MTTDEVERALRYCFSLSLWEEARKKMRRGAFTQVEWRRLWRDVHPLGNSVHE